MNEPGQILPSLHHRNGYRCLCGACEAETITWVKDGPSLRTFSGKGVQQGWGYQNGYGWCCPACSRFISSLEPAQEDDDDD